MKCKASLNRYSEGLQEFAKVLMVMLRTVSVKLALSPPRCMSSAAARQISISNLETQLSETATPITLPENNGHLSIGNTLFSWRKTL